MNDWIIFGFVILLMLFFDLYYQGQKVETPNFRKNLIISILYIIISLLFGVWIYYSRGDIAAKNFINVYLLEKTLSIDNVFVISAIFGYFKIVPQYQRRVLFWGLAGVIIFRAIMIALGASLVSRFEYILYIFGIILIYTGVKMLTSSEHKMNFKENFLIKLMYKYFNISNSLSKEVFYVKKDNKIYFTKLTLSLILIELMDLIFALDSIPVAFAITQDQYIIYTSNVFAIIGLRSLYICLSVAKAEFKYLKHSLSIILMFIGVKILIGHYIKIPASFTLSFTAIIIAVGVLASIQVKRAQLLVKK